MLPPVMPVVVPAPMLPGEVEMVLPVELDMPPVVDPFIEPEVPIEPMLPDEPMLPEVPMLPDVPVESTPVLVEPVARDDRDVRPVVALPRRPRADVVLDVVVERVEVPVCDRMEPDPVVEPLMPPIDDPPIDPPVVEPDV